MLPASHVDEEEEEEEMLKGTIAIPYIPIAIPFIPIGITIVIVIAFAIAMYLMEK